MSRRNEYAGIIGEIFSAAKRIFPQNPAQYGMWFVLMAYARTQLNPHFADGDRLGLFAIEPQTFDSVCRRLKIERPAIFDPYHNALATAYYIRWAMEKLAEFIPDELERFAAGFACLDRGLLTVIRDLRRN